MKQIGLATALLAATALIPTTGSATELTASIWFPDTHPLTSHGYLRWAEQVSEASGGDLTIRVMVGEALLPAAAHLSGLRDGIADMTYHAGTYTPSDLPQDNVLAILGIGMTNNIVITAAVTDFYMNDPDMKAMFDSHEIVFLGGYATPPYILMCTSPVRTLEDIRGKRIRMPGAIHAEFADSVDAVAVSVPSTEMFTGLERGQLDCAANAANDLKSRSLWDVAKHVTVLDLGSYFAGWLHAANVGAWQGLSEAQREVILTTLPDTLVETTLEYTRLSDEGLAEAPSHGVTIYEPADDLRDALASFNADQVPEIAVREGRERFRLSDPEGLIERFEATRAKWEDIFGAVDLDDPEAIKAALRENLFDQIDISSYGM